MPVDGGDGGGTGLGTVFEAAAAGLARFGREGGAAAPWDPAFEEPRRELTT